MTIYESDLIDMLNELGWPVFEGEGKMIRTGFMGLNTYRDDEGEPCALLWLFALEESNTFKVVITRINYPGISGDGVDIDEKISMQIKCINKIF